MAAAYIMVSAFFLDCFSPISMVDFADPTTRRAAFLVACLGARSALAAAARYCIESAPVRLALVIFAATASLGWLRLFAFRQRMAAPEAGATGTWWHGLRPVHAALYAAFVVLATRSTASERAYAWVPLGVDVALAVVAWFAHGRHKAV